MYRMGRVASRVAAGRRFGNPISVCARAAPAQRLAHVPPVWPGRMRRGSTRGHGHTSVGLSAPAHEAMQTRIMATLPSFIEHFHDIPVYVIPCLFGRSEGQPAIIQSALWGTIAPAAWNFMLAARARGLGTVWTCLHLFFEEEAAQVLGIPYAKVMQACLIPVAYTQGTRFKPAWREPLDTIIHWETW